MPRKKVEINPIRGKRLKELLNDQKTDQKELSKQIFISAQTISKIVNGKATLTEQTARLVIDKYPFYNFEWLMGYSDFKYNHSEKKHNDDLLKVGMNAFESMLNYQIAPVIPMKQGVSNIKEYMTAYMETYNSGYFIRRGNLQGHLSVNEYNSLKQEITDFIDFKLSKYLKETIKKGGNDNGEN